LAIETSLHVVYLMDRSEVHASVRRTYLLKRVILLYVPGNSMSLLFFLNL